MNCTLSALVGIGMLGAAVSTMTVSKEQHDLLKETLSDELDQVYDSIAIERRNHYLMGLALGLVLAFMTLRMVKTSNRFHRMTLFTLITLVTAVTVYSVLPKSDYMLNHLKTEEQTKAWLEVYKTMKHRYMLGFALGSLAAIPLAYAMC
jgi:uncharacterized protein YacL